MDQSLESPFAAQSPHHEEVPATSAKQEVQLDDVIVSIGKLNLEENEAPLANQPRASQKKKKDLPHIQCFKCQKYSHCAK